MFPGAGFGAPPPEHPIEHLSEFLRSPQGRYVVEWEQRQFDHLVADIFGYHALQLGLPDVFIEHGDPAKLLSLQGLDAAGIRASIAARFLPDNAA